MTAAPEFVSAEDIAVLYGVPVADVWAFAPPNQLPWCPPVEWLPQGRRRANEAMAHTNSSDFWLCIDYLRGVPMDRTAELLLPLRPELVGRATYTVRRRVPSPWLGVKVGGSLACLVPLAIAIAQILGGGAA